MKFKIFAVLGLLLLFITTAIAGRIGGNVNRLGAKTGADIDLLMGVSTLRANDATGKLQVSNGAGFVDIGEGGGGGAGGTNVLSNPGFEDGSATDWTKTGSSTLVDLSSAADVGFGVLSARWDAANAAEQLNSDAITMIAGLAGRSCLAKMDYKGGDANISLKVIKDPAGSPVEVASLTLEAATDWRSAFVGFDCGAQGDTYALRLESSANAAAIDLDEMHLGSQILLADFGIAEDYGSILWPQTANCIWTITQTSYASDFPVDADCPAPTVAGKVTAPGTKLPHLVMNNAPPGVYVVTYVGQVGTGGEAACRLVDDSGTQLASQVIANAGVAQGRTIMGRIEYTTAANRTIKMQCRSSAGTATLELTRPEGDTQIFVQRFPTTKQNALVGIETSGWYVDANISSTASVALGISAQATYTGLTASDLVMVNNAGGLAAQIACATTEESAGLTCSADESVGFSFTLPSAGAVKVCAEFGTDMAGATSSLAYQLVETPNAAQTISAEGNGRAILGGGAGDFAPSQVCGVFNFVSSGKKTIRLFYEKPATGSSPTLRTDAQVAIGQHDLHFVAYPINQQIPMPKLVKQLQSSSSAIMTYATAHISNSGVPAVAREDGDWINGAPVDNATGDVTLNIVASTFSAIPNCFCQAHAETGDADAASCEVDKTTTPSASVYRFRTRVGAALTDRDFSVSCTGPK